MRFQLYVMNDPGLARSLIERAKETNSSVLVLTVELAAHGKRERYARNGFSVPTPTHLRPRALGATACFAGRPVVSCRTGHRN